MPWRPFEDGQGGTERGIILLDKDMKRGLDHILELIPYEIDPERDDKMRVTADAIEDFVKQLP